MDKSCPRHKEYYTGCNSCQHDCIDDNEELKAKIKQLEAALKISINGWERCYMAYDSQVTGISIRESLSNLQKEPDYQEAQKVLED